LGKTLTPEFTLANLPNISSASNILNGLVRNPYNLEHNASASSGGAGAIVAAAGSYFDIGSDFGGSIRGPAHVNGITGLKPQTGRVPRTGHIVDFGGIYDSYQQIGPLARRVEDLDLLLRVIAGPDYRDAAIKPGPLSNFRQVDVKKLRVAYYYSTPIGESTADTKAVIKKALDALSSAGAKLTEDIHPRYQEMIDIRAALNAAEGRSWIKRLANKWGSKTLSGANNFEPSGATTADVTEMLERQDACRSAMLQWFQNYDVIVCPNAISPATKLHDVSQANLYYNSIYNIAGWPAGVVRGGTSAEGGLPIGVHIIAHPWREDIVLGTATFLEQQLGGYQRPPDFPES
jgi:amidase